MSRYVSPAPWFKHYRRRLPDVLKKLGRIATVKQITKELVQQQVDGANESSVRAYCESCCVNGTGRHNLHYRGDYDPEFHFLLKIAAGVYALPDPKYLDMSSI